MEREIVQKKKQRGNKYEIARVWCLRNNTYIIDCVIVERLPLAGSTGRGCTTSVYSTSGSLVTMLLSSSMATSKQVNTIICKT